ncbi:hypothetical protein V2J09_004300 [Rumex salicifolius]
MIVVQCAKEVRRMWATCFGIVIWCADSGCSCPTRWVIGCRSFALRFGGFGSGEMPSSSKGRPLWEIGLTLFSRRPTSIIRLGAYETH